MADETITIKKKDFEMFLWLMLDDCHGIHEAAYDRLLRIIGDDRASFPFLETVDGCDGRRFLPEDWRKNLSEINAKRFIT